MPEQTIEISGTVQSTGQQKITGTGKIISSDSPPKEYSTQAIRITFAVTLTLTITLTITFALTFEFLLKGSVSNVQTTTKSSVPDDIKAKEFFSLDSLAVELRGFGIDGSIVVVKVFDNLTDAEYFKSTLREKRVNGKSLFFRSKHCVYIGPLYGSRRTSSVLRHVWLLGYTNASVVRPQ